MSVGLKRAAAADLPAINAVISAAVMGWRLPERVKRLALSSYLYSEVDFTYLELWLVLDGAGKVLAVAAWEPADAADLPQAKTGLLLHGIYVQPEQQRHGIGRLLFDRAIHAAGEAQLDGLLVKAQEDAVGFFETLGMQLLPVTDEARHYDKRYWLALPPD